MIGWLSVLLLAAAEPRITAEQLFERIESELASTHTAQFDVYSWQKKGRKVQEELFRTWWNGPDQVRVEVLSGDSSNTVAILNNDTVVGWRKGLLSFIRPSMDRYGKMATSVRGNDIGKAGYFDELRDLLAHRNSARVGVDEIGPVVRYTDANGLLTALWFQMEPFRVLSQEILEDGQVVERYRFSEVIINPDLDPELFEP
jgi:outer membrane lipoprotein-sorting protein